MPTDKVKTNELEGGIEDRATASNLEQIFEIIHVICWLLKNFLDSSQYMRH